MSRLCLFTLILSLLLLLHAAAGEAEPEPASHELSTHGKDEAADEPASSADDEPAEAPSGSRRMGKHHTDKSMAGGGVIIGGLVTAIFAAVFCYIRVTRKQNGVV